MMTLGLPSCGPGSIHQCDHDLESSFKGVLSGSTTALVSKAKPFTSTFDAECGGTQTALFPATFTSLHLPAFMVTIPRSTRSSLHLQQLCPRQSFYKYIHPHDTRHPLPILNSGRCVFEDQHSAIRNYHTFYLHVQLQVTKIWDLKAVCS